MFSFFYVARDIEKKIDRERGVHKKLGTKYFFVIANV
jgi:hypothetical protein